MTDTTQNNAMAEIALALAMGFFSIMVLTMVSMGSGLTQSQPTDLIKNGAELGQTPENATDKSTASLEQVKPDNLIVFFEGNYFDASLKPVSIATLTGRAELVLGVDPLLPMNEALKARRNIKSEGVTVVPLNAQWMNRLEAKTP